MFRHTAAEYIVIFDKIYIYILSAELFKNVVISEIGLEN